MSNRIKKLLQWMVDHNQEDRGVTIGCKSCKEVKNLMASTALVAWLCFHEGEGHQVWMRNPFPKKGA